MLTVRNIVLYDSFDVPMAVENGVAVPVGTRAIMVAGSDGASARFIRTAADGTVRVDPTGTTPQPVTGTVTIGDPIGQDVMAASVAVAIASDQSSIPVDDDGGSLTVDTPQLPATLDTGNLRTKETRSATSAVTTVAGSAASVTLLAANAARLGFSVYNDSNATMYLKYGATASTTSFTVKLDKDSIWTDPWDWTGVIDAIWTAASGNARMTELS
jgi:hypothetical protein